jgi:adenylyltransferase/sulfurtransferase
MNNDDAALTESEKQRYNRQIILPDWGEAGQQKLKKATVFIAGAGGLGSPVALYLTAAGIGCIRICDAGSVELSNLNRQIIYEEADIGASKSLSAKNSLEMLNHNVKVVPVSEEIKKSNVSRLIGKVDLIIDCLDNFAARYILNEFAVKRRLPFIHAGVYGMSGQITFIHPPLTPCLKCIFPEAPPPDTLPIVGAAPGMIGCIEAQEALKYITGIGALLMNKLLLWDGNGALFEEFQIEKDPSCPVCGHGA